MNKKLFLIPLALILAGGGCWYAWQKMHEKSPGSSQMMPSGPMTVAVITLQNQKITLDYTLPGRITPFKQSQIRPQVDGLITERLFEEGADVAKGQQLYQIDDARYKAALNSAMADLKSAKANVKTVEARAGRYKQLVKINAISQQEYEDVQAELDQANAAIAVAQAAVDVAQVNLDYTKVYAPISGRIGKSFVTEGALVTANQDQNLSVITQLNPVYIDIQQSGTQAMLLRSRMMTLDTIPVKLTIDEVLKEPYPHTGTLKFSEVTIDETAGSIALRALMPNPEGILLPGLFVNANLSLGQEDVLLVPQRAATRTPEGTLMVWIVDSGNKAQPRPIQIKDAYKNNWIVTNGVSAGDTIIIEGYQKLVPDSPVTTTPWSQQKH